MKFLNCSPMWAGRVSQALFLSRGAVGMMAETEKTFMVLTFCLRALDWTMGLLMA